MAIERLNDVDSADVRGIFGDQRKGKTTIATGFAVDDYCDKMTGLVFANGLRCDAQALTDGDLDFLETRGIQAFKTTYCRVFNKDHSQSKIIEIPPQSIIESPIRIFANYHLYGVYYVFLDIFRIIDYVNTDLIRDAWVLMDESTLIDTRNSMTKEGKIIAEFGSQIGKRGLHLCTIAQYISQIERRYRLFKTTTIECVSYDKQTYIITCNIKEKGKPKTDSEFYAPPYWRYFDTHEVLPIPEHQRNSALDKISKGQIRDS